MQRLILLCVALVMGGGLLAAPAASHAADFEFRLLPEKATGTCPDPKKLGNMSEEDAREQGLCNYSICDFLTVADNAIKLMVGITGPLAMLFLVVSGIRLIVAGGNASKVESARKALVAAIIGTVIVLLAWTSVHVILGLLARQFWGADESQWSSAPWSQIRCETKGGFIDQSPEDPGDDADAGDSASTDEEVTSLGTGDQPNGIPDQTLIFDPSPDPFDPSPQDQLPSIF